MNTTFKRAALAIALSAGMVGASQAAFIPLPTGVIAFEDDNLEYLSRLNQLTGQYEIVGRDDFAGAGALQVGDRLTAVITFPTIRVQETNAIWANLGQPGTELTGISEIEVKGFFVDGLGNNRIQWGTSSAFETAYGSGAMAALFSQNPGNFDVSCSSANVADCVNPATDGSLYLVAGFSDVDDYWSSTGAGATVGAAAALSSGTAFGQANYSLTLLQNNTGYQFVQQLDGANATFNPLGAVQGDGFVDLIGSGQLLGGAGLLGPWFARSDFDFTLERVPVPATLGLLGLGLIGLAGVSRRRRSVA